MRSAAKARASSASVPSSSRAVRSYSALRARPMRPARRSVGDGAGGGRGGRRRAGRRRGGRGGVVVVRVDWLAPRRPGAGRLAGEVGRGERGLGVQALPGGGEAAGRGGAGAGEDGDGDCAVQPLFRSCQ